MNNAAKLLGFEFGAEEFVRLVPKPRENAGALKILSEIIEKHGDSQPKPPPDVGTVYKRFTIVAPRGLDAMQMMFESTRKARSFSRKLAWCLSYCENTPPYNVPIIQKPFLPLALQLIDEHFRPGMLLGLLDALLKNWSSPNIRLVRDFIREKISHYKGKRKNIIAIKENVEWYLDERGPILLATTLLGEGQKLSTVWEYLGLPKYMQGYEFFGAVGTAFTSLALRAGTPSKHFKDIVGFLEEHNEHTCMKKILSAVIEKLGETASESIRQPIQSFTLKRLQDPRLTGGMVRWQGISETAKKIFIRWLTKEDLRFFFDVVAKACGDDKFEYRKEFWLAYLEHISFCRVVLRKDAKYLFRNDVQAMRYFNERRPAKITGGTVDQHAFIIEMGDYTFVEFSTAGACYVYPNERKPFRTDLSEYAMSDLRNRNRAVERFIHRNSERYSWQRKVRDWIEWNLELEPLHSYLVK